MLNDYIALALSLAIKFEFKFAWLVILAVLFLGWLVFKEVRRKNYY